MIPDLIARNQITKRLRIWCAGCSIGAEPYSIAILLHENFSYLLKGWDVRVIGTDLNRDFLSRAREGKFVDWSFRSCTEEFKITHFVSDGKSWKIKDHLKSMVSFQHHNLLRDPIPSVLHELGALDLIVCRNVMIYFERAVNERLVNQFEDALNSGGWLVLGHSEQIQVQSNLKLHHFPKVTVFQKEEALPALPNFSLPRIDPSVVADFSPPTSLLQPKFNAENHAVKREIQTIKELADRGQFEAALSICDRLLLVEKKNALLYFYKAIISDQQVGGPGVEQNLKQAVLLDQDFVFAHYYLGQFYRKRSDSYRASRSFQTVLRLLSRLDGDRQFDEADGISVTELKRLVLSQLEAA
ncbi:MAG: hypothetical protein EOP09_15555 [Proteobacteria bacterium]|nr:MAG: hypothetical protein EOP09_15555 [Pseudomonadota bacterium]